ncbi:hypothetical protein [Methylocystis sp.]
MRPEHDGVAWPSTKFICKQLGVSSESKVRSALYALLERGYLAAERKAGETTRYRIADRYFDRSTPPRIGATTQPLYGAGSDDTPPPIGANPQPLYGAGRAPPIGATNTVNRKPLIEDRKPPLYSPNRSGADSIWPGDEAVSSFGAMPSTFGRFEAAWQWRQGESVRAARIAFHRLSESDRESAIKGAPAFQVAMAYRQYPPHASTYLGERKWTFTPRSPPRPAKAPRGGVGALLAESYGFDHAHCPQKTINLVAARLGDDAPARESTVERLKDGRCRLHPNSEQMLRWREHERRTLGKARPGLTRPSEWPPGTSSPNEPFVDGAEALR